MGLKYCERLYDFVATSLPAETFLYASIIFMFLCDHCSKEGLQYFSIKKEMQTHLS